MISVLWLSCLHAAVLGWTSMPRPVLVISCVQWRPPAARGTIVCRSLASDTPPPKQRFHVAPMQVFASASVSCSCLLCAQRICGMMLLFYYRPTRTATSGNFAVYSAKKQCCGPRWKRRMTC